MTAEGKNLPAAEIKPRWLDGRTQWGGNRPSFHAGFSRRIGSHELGFNLHPRGGCLDAGGRPICFASGIGKLKIHSQGEPEHFMKRRNQAESDTQREEPRLTYAEVRFDENLQEVIQRAADHLLSLQAPEGFWVGELEADTTLESDYIFFLYVLGKLDSRRCVKLANYIRRRQLPDGGWNIYAGGPSELNATVKAYVALKLAGDSPAAPHMARARCQIHELGGVEATNSYTRLYLALGGVLPWSYVPAIPPELILLPLGSF